LIALLEDCDPDAQVRLAHQPTWPLQFTLAGIITTTDDLDQARTDPAIAGTGSDADADADAGHDGQAVVCGTVLPQVEAVEQVGGGW
jgi:hypothetical protein